MAPLGKRPMSAVYRTVGIVGAGLFMSLAIAAFVFPTSEVELPAAPATNARTLGFSPLPAVEDRAAGRILEMSPFSPDRSPFDRSTASSVPPPPVEVKLTGVFKLGKELRATITVNGQPMTVGKGDDTAAGRVLAIGPTSIGLAGPPERTVEMFR